MRGTMKLDLNKAVLAVSFIMGLSGLVGAWAVIPYRVGVVEEMVEKQAVSRNKDHVDLKVLISEVKGLRDDIKELKDKTK